jgi:nicotinamide riboside kinase
MRNVPFIITIFGAESTGKTTLSKQLARVLGGDWKEEFARPYLEQTGQDVTNASMRAIWRGQKVLQLQARRSHAACVIQDTDLFSTVGYWRLPHVEPVIGPCPQDLVLDAQELRTGLYIITPSNIPFEPDILRYGGDKRESPDAYWITLCKHYALPFVVLSASGQQERLDEAIAHINERSLSCVAS